MKLVLSLSVMIGLLSGCSMWPTLKEDSKLDPNTTADYPCITNDPIKARNCAILTISEVSNLMDDVGVYNRGSAYTALTLGTLTGGVLAFEGSEDALKGLAVLSGGLLGLNTVVDTATQRVIFERALKDLYCSVRAFDALQSASIKQNIASKNFQNLSAKSPVTLYSAISRFERLNQKNHFSAFSESVKVLSIEKETRKALHFEKMSKNGAAIFRALNSAQVTAASKLSNAVIAIRADIRAKLAGMVGSPEEIFGAQRDRIVDMTGEIVRRRSELENQQDEQPPGDDSEAEEIVAKTASLIADTADIISVFRECVDPATQREIEN